MIIPIRCFTCGKVLADKWNYFKKKSIEMDEKTNEQELTIKDLKLDESTKRNNYFDSNMKGKLLDDLGLKRICCRRHMMGHVDLVDII